jgi:cytochrome d ubiquinol oxidase subunit I
MVGTGLLMLLVSWWGAFAGRRARWQPAQLPRLLLRVQAAMMFAGWLATTAGWYVTEIGRQPFLVQGLLRTSEAASATPAAWIGLTLAAWLTIYAVLIVAFVRVLLHMAAKPVPGARDAGVPVVPPARAAAAA